jgi:hypothetical protein
MRCNIIFVNGDVLTGEFGPSREGFISLESPVGTTYYAIHTVKAFTLFRSEPDRPVSGYERNKMVVDRCYPELDKTTRQNPLIVPTCND